MQHLRDFARSGNPGTLVAAFLYFDVSFMIWVLLGPLGNFLAEDLHLSAAARGLVIALPLLSGSLFRLVMGPFADRWGGRRVGMLGMLVTVLPLVLGWCWADSLPRLWVVGLLLGVAGASFAVALPLASRWYPAEHQGLVLGLAGAGNSGSLLATLFAPRLAEIVGWRGVFGLALLPLAVVLIVFALLARDAPSRAAGDGLAGYRQALREGDIGWFCLLYALTFGGFVGLASFLPVYFRDQFGASRVQSGDLATLSILAGSFLRPVGGYLADRLGGRRVLQGLLLGVAVLAASIGARPGLAAVTLLFVPLLALLGMGNGAVFQLIPQRYPRQLGSVTGLVGAVGGLGGFFLPSAMGILRERAGTFAPGFFIFALAALAGLAVLGSVGRGWQRARRGQPALAAGGAE
jgi:NNP family nitrate/nitrite transporter-like MFS transporter